MRQALHAFVWIGVAFIGHARADEAPITYWQCKDDGHLQLACSVQRVAAPLLSAATAAPADALPPIVRQIRERPGEWRQRVLWIPLHNHPFDLDHVRELAQAVLCGPRSDCIARVVGADAQDDTPVDWADFADAHDPLLAQND